MSPQSADLAIIVVNYGSHGLLERNLVPLSQDLPDAATVVVDNWTTEHERDAIRRLADDRGWHLVAPRRNLGFGAGVNLGVESARALGSDTFLILNPDAAIDPDSLRLLTDTVHADPLVLAVPSARRPDGRPWPTAHRLDLARGSLKPGSGTWQWVSGACMALSEELWLKLGGFGDDYFLYWEDVDLAYRTEQLGGRLAVVGEAVAVHDEGGTQTTRTDPSWSRSEAYYYYNIRNRLVFAARNLPAAQARAWLRWSIPAAYYVLAIGGRRKFLQPWRPAAIAYRGIRDGRRYLRASLA